MRKVIKLKDMPVANPAYSARAVKQCSIAAVIMLFLIKTGIL